MLRDDDERLADGCSDAGLEEDVWVEGGEVRNNKFAVMKVADDGCVDDG
ncbi:hypothetical protein [Arsenicicoccus bolidensis]|nr:hypothetical protein [Arsenicicoccus bolidensis]